MTTQKHSGCDASCGCGSCCDSHWQIRAGALTLQRDRSDAQTLVIIPGTGPYVDASDFLLDFKTGWELAIEKELNCLYAAEVRYFQVDDILDRIDLPIATAYVLNTGGGFIGIGGTDVNGSIQYESNLWDLEANIKRHLRGFDLIGGFRYLSLREKLTLDLQRTLPTVSSTTMRYATSNDLYGFQLGLERTFAPQCSKWQLDFRAIAGVYYNDAELRTRNALLNAVAVEGGVSDDQVAFVGEIDFTASYAINCNWSIIAAAELLWLDGVALATDQPAVNDLTNQPMTTVAMNGSPFYTGLFFGLEYIH